MDGGVCAWWCGVGVGVVLMLMRMLIRYIDTVDKYSVDELSRRGGGREG